MAFTDRKPKFNKKNPYIDRRESKNREIRQALVHKARLKKKYIKELEKSGEKLPERSSKREEEAEKKKNQLTFQDRQKLAKERKKASREQREKEKLERELQVEKKQKEREKKKEALAQRTKYGQPLMGPRINNLLEKIQKEYGDKK
ncbi:CYFA0S05e04324g1_1 [Cyberlindnera fabianii]|uniref:rRNA-processing protein FYV7 n=1 Tax=Cyberlindnera fabianii TaxID=36022 RepID=A0A061AUB4_CYBFA|nr:CYFA0S05e04324g1_1 [Cyberlindnera fabianii]